MNEATAAVPAPQAGAANAALTGSAVFWWLMALLGQWAFLYYIAAFYGPTVLSGDYVSWNRGKAGMFFKGYIPGDTAGNLAFLAHAMLAAYVAFGGALQLVPQIRAYAPSFHRGNGRVFLTTALGLSLTGLYMVWVRGASQSLLHSEIISANAALIVVFAGLAWRSALRRDFDSHRRWALRTYMVANGQWFFRVGLFAWVVVSAAVAGKPRHVGRFLFYWDFGSYLVPLAVMEIYLRVKQSAGPHGRYVVAGALVLLTVLMAAGTVTFSIFTWKQFLS